MRIALMSTSAVSVPPAAYGGTELFVADLAEGLVARGHEVVVYSTGDSQPAGELRWKYAQTTWPPDPAHEADHVAWAWRDIASDRFDLVHVNDPQALISPDRVADVPTVITVHHSRNEALNDMMRQGPAAHIVAISRRQAELVPELPITQVIHHGLAPRLYPRGRGDGGYAAFLGRFTEEKAPHLAIDAARAAGVRLRMGGPYWRQIPEHERYFRQYLRQRLDEAGARVEWVGEVDHRRKIALVGGACALLVPLRWEEPFGLVMIESMLVGTPVIAFARGAAPEIIDEGTTGFLVHSPEEMSARLAEVSRLDRGLCRARAQARWSAERMIGDYEALYRRIVGRDAAPIDIGADDSGPVESTDVGDEPAAPTAAGAAIA